MAPGGKSLVRMFTTFAWVRETKGLETRSKGESEKESMLSLEQ